MDQKQNKWGQWIGTISGTNNGIAMLNIDADRTDRALVTLSDTDKEKPSIIAELFISNDGEKLSGKSTKIWSFYEANKNQGVGELPNSIQVSGEFDEFGRINVTWSTDIETSGTVVLHGYENDGPKMANHEMSWDEFSDYAKLKSREKPHLIFRGQCDNSWSLMTSYHRKQRRNLIRYLKEDLPKLNKYVTPEIQEEFDLTSDRQILELVLLGQHHGFPTPFLDWTTSPFIASYFAFHDLSKENPGEGKVRIYIFDHKAWKEHGPKDTGKYLSDPRPSFELLDIVTKNNNRVIPQQALVTYTNLCNLEHYINFYQKHNDVVILETIDIEMSERNKVITDLNIMGISTSTMFPGLDGICKTLAENLF